MEDILTNIEAPNKVRNYWDIQREVIGCVDIDEQCAIFEAIRYGIKIAHNLGYNKGYENTRRTQITEVFIPNISVNIEKGISPNGLRDIMGCDPIIQK